MQRLKYCSYCGNLLNKITDTEYECSDGHKVYNNPLMCAGVIPIKDGKALLGRRAMEPKKGTIDVVGGFAEYMETPEEAAVRETKEETGLEIKLTGYLGSSVNFYQDDTSTSPVIFTAEVIGGEEKPNDDVASLEWYPIDDLPKSGFSWDWVGEMLRELEKRHNSNG